jgi:hypothetical protein
MSERLIDRIIDTKLFGEAIDNDAPRKMSSNVHDYIAGPAVKAAMKFHGIDMMEAFPEKMEAFFYRKGKKMRVSLPPEVYKEMLNKYDASR